MSGTTIIAHISMSLSGHSERSAKLVFNTDYALCRSKVLQKAPSILQYFRPSLSYYLPLRSLFVYF